MDETLPSSTALKQVFLEKAVTSWLSAKEKDGKVTHLTPLQLQTCFRLIKVDFEGKFSEKDMTDVQMKSEHSQIAPPDEEMKSDLDDIPLLKRFSSDAQVEPYSRFGTLLKAVGLLQKSIIKY